MTADPDLANGMADGMADALERARRIALRFLEGLDARPAGAANRAAPGLGLAETGVGLAAALNEFAARIEGGLSASAGPRYLGYVTGGATPAALAGDWLAAAVDQNVGMPGCSVASALTAETIGGLLDLFGLAGQGFDGTFTSGATAANLLGLLAARQALAEAAGVDVTAKGLAAAPPIKVFSACPHASTLKAVGVAGLGRDNIVAVGRLPASEAMDPAALQTALAADDGTAAIVVASAGTVSGTDFDDLVAVSEIARRFGAWLHVDGAFGIYGRLLEDLAPLVRGLELADSITADGHKWLNVPYDCGFFFTRHMDVLERALAVPAAYLQTNDAAPRYIDRGLESSQRFRALPVWMTLRAMGRAGIADMVAGNCRQASTLGQWLAAADGFDLLKPVGLNVVLFAAAGGDRASRKLLQVANATGKLFVTPGTWQGRFAIRAAFSNWRTTDADLDIITDALRGAAKG